MKTLGIGVAVSLIAGGALLAMGYEVAGTIVGIVGSLLALTWPKLLAKLGIRSSR